MADDFIVRASEELKAAKAREVPNAAPTAESIIEDAKAVVRERRRSYGPPKEHFARTVGMINALFAHKLKEPLTVEDWPQIMLCDKLARHQERPVRDTPIDVIGYGACMGEAMR